MSNNQTARELNEACIAACSACPTYREPDEDTEELVHGKLITVQTLHTKGLQAVRSYWNDRDSIGGSILWDSGYASELDPQQLEVLTTDPRDAEIARLRAELAEANGYINRLRDMLTDSHPCIDPSRDACNCILCELVSRERQQAALAAKEGE